jgi:hypothetical protein
MKRITHGMLWLFLGGFLLPAIANAACPCFTEAQLERWLRLAHQASARLCFCDPASGLPEIIFQIAPNGCFQSGASNTLDISADAVSPSCRVTTSNTEGLEGIPEKSLAITPKQVNQCIDLIRKACGG